METNQARVILRSGVILSAEDFDSDLGCTTVRHIIFGGEHWVHVMLNGEVLAVTNIEEVLK